MLEQEQELRKASGPPVPLPVVGIALLLAAAVAGYLWWQSQNSSGEGPRLTEEAQAYLSHLDLSGVEMKAEEDFLQQTLVTIEGGISNQGERTVQLVEVNCVFRDPYGAEILRQPAVIIGQRSGPAAPGDTKSFRLAFDAIPPEWNQTMPDLFISQIQFE